MPLPNPSPAHQLQIARFDSIKSPAGTRISLDWAEFCKRLKFERIEDKKARSLFAAAELADDDGTTDGAPHRTAAHVISRTAVVLDVEAPPASTAQPPQPLDMVRRLKSFGGKWAIYTSFSHSPAKPRYRIIVPCDQPMDPMLPICEELAERLELSSFIDQTKFGANAIFFFPSCPSSPDGDAHTLLQYSTEGEGIDDTLICAAQARLDRIEAEQERQAQAAAERAQKAADERKERAGGRTFDQTFIEAARAILPTIEQQLARAGYKGSIQKKKTNRWIYPHSTTGTAGVVVLKDGNPTRVFSHHKDDPLATFAPGHALDSIDVYTVLTHNGNVEAANDDIRQMLRPDPFEHANERAGLNDDAGFDTYDAEPDAEQGEQGEQAAGAAPQPAGWPTPFTDFNEAGIPRRRWVYGYDYIRSYLSVLASAGGIGKTSLTLVEALAIATARPLLGQPVREQANVWVINLEDPYVELQMRTLAAMKHYGVSQASVEGRLFIDAEDTIAIKLAVENRDGIQINDKLIDKMIHEIRRNDIGVVILDPFISSHNVNENSNVAVQEVVATLRAIARKTEASVMAVHHVRKGNGTDATIDSVRGASALIGAARAARVINRMSGDEARELGIPADLARSIFRVEDGKANLAPPAGAALYRRMVSVTIDNGEHIGVATEYQLPDQWAGMTDLVINAMLDAIDRGPEDGERWRESRRGRGGARWWVGNVITQWEFADPEHQKSDADARNILNEWTENGLIEVIDFESPAAHRVVRAVVSAGRVGEQN